MDRTRGQPPKQYLSAAHVLDELCRFGTHRLKRLNAAQIMVLGALAGGFITMGAFLSLLLAEGAGTEGATRILEGVGFSSGFFFVVLSEAALFTEANVVLPAVLLYRRPGTVASQVIRFWALAWLGNYLGALIVGALIVIAQPLSGGIQAELSTIVARKMSYAQIGTAGAWGLALLSGVLANWLVGMAAFFATMGRTIVGKYIPIFLAVTLFVAANFQHSPANMGYFSLAIPLGIGPSWVKAFLWNIIPVGLGNMLGGGLLVALPFWYTLKPDQRRKIADEAAK